MELSSGIVAAASNPTSTAPTNAFGRADVPSIIAPGPWIAFCALALGVILDSTDVFKVVGHLPPLIRIPAALALVSLGGWCILRANVTFHRIETPFQPWRPTRAIAAQDIYARTRNPMYQGFLILVLGLAVLLRSDWGVLMMMPAAMLIHHGVVMREESYLERRFGDAYRQYQAAVPRYGWPFKLLGAWLPRGLAGNETAQTLVTSRETGRAASGAEKLTQSAQA
jgi:protein-S-isoprenylcysteine O-methyltransferase Ste14